MERAQQERRRRENERRLEGQLREFERRREARRKAEEVTAAGADAVNDAQAAAVRAQTPSKVEPDERSKRGKRRSRLRNEGPPQVQPERGQQPQSPAEENKTQLGSSEQVKRGQKPRTATAKADDQKENTGNDAAAASAAGLVIADGEEHSIPLLTACVCVLFSPQPWDDKTDRQPHP